MAARALDRMRKAQSLIRECHSWFVENEEILLAVELCQIEGRLALFFENRCFANSPCPGLRDEQLPRLVSTECSISDDYALNTNIILPKASIQRCHRRGTHRQPYNGGRKPHQINRSRTEVPASRAGGGQNARVQAAITSRGKVSKLTYPNADVKIPRVRAAVTRASPPTGVLLDFDNDVELVQLPPNMVADMEAANSADVGSKEKQPLPGGPAAVSSDEPALGGLVRVDGDDRSLHQTVATAAGTASAGLDSSVGSYCSPLAVEEGVVPVPDPSQPQLPGSPACDSPEDESSHTSQTYQRVNETTEFQKGNFSDEFPVLTSIGGFTEDVLVDLDDDLAVILPGGTDTDTESTTHIEEKDFLVGGVDSRACHNLQTEDSEDDEIVFQGKEANSICPDFKALFVSSDNDSQPSHRAIDLKAISEKYSEVIIRK
ncbi:hypothetical protein N7447_000729 [Penicillium robsamsonii]|uniref:uncharacterized protein n=1 Tax=Penicillium robsamsonii TaxID=1792511 RepID=UPI002547FB67|nr:uncharacterized protein N7447_000729 [Penicillium robsamsonii]KAJ5834703.1 hypothetical protein N7447_000729 [Penicillium robsamsonii]